MTSPAIAPGLLGDRPGHAPTDTVMSRFQRETVLPNLRAGVSSILARPVREMGIDEVDDDPIYENLYDRCYALLADGAELEHLAVATIVEPSDTLTQTAARRLDALCVAWSPEVGKEINYGNAYALSRLLKGMAVGYATFGHALTRAQRARCEGLLVSLTSAMWTEWFARPPVRGPVGFVADRHSPHHSSVEWSAFGVSALALLEVTPDAAEWVEAATTQFADELLPCALGVDGAPPEGAYFWISTMFSRAQFLEALCNRTGTDLLAGREHTLRFDLADALVRTVPPLEPAEEGEDRLDRAARPFLPHGFGGVLLWIAARLSDPHAQALALRDGRAGAFESLRSATPTRNIRLRLPTNSYAALWLCHDLEPVVNPSPRLATFPTVWLCARGPRRDEDLAQATFSAAIDQGRVLVWLGEQLVYQDLMPESITDMEASTAAGSAVCRYEPPALFGAQVGAWRQPDRDILEARSPEDLPVARVVLSSASTEVRIDRRVVPGHAWRTSLELHSDPETSSWALVDADRVVDVSVDDGNFQVGGPVDRRTRVGYDLLELVDDPPDLTIFEHHHVDEGESVVRWVTILLTLRPPRTETV